MQKATPAFGLAPKYKVITKEVWIQPIIVEANNKEEALEIVADGGGEMLSNEFEYSHTQDTDTWEVQENQEATESTDAKTGA